MTAPLNLCTIYLKATWPLTTLSEHTHKNSKINWTKIKSSCQMVTKSCSIGFLYGVISSALHSMFWYSSLVYPTPPALLATVVQWKQGRPQTTEEREVVLQFKAYIHGKITTKKKRRKFLKTTNK